MTPMLRAQAGRPYAPTFIARLNYNTSVPIYASPRGEQRNDNVAVFDIRVAKAFTFGQSKKLRGFLDVYNITNTNAVQDMTVSYGSELPSSVADQRPADRPHRRPVRVLAETNMKRLLAAMSHGLEPDGDRVHQRRARRAATAAGAGGAAAPPVAGEHGSGDARRHADQVSAACRAGSLRRPRRQADAPVRRRAGARSRGATAIRAIRSSGGASSAPRRMPRTWSGCWRSSRRPA